MYNVQWSVKDADFQQQARVIGIVWKGQQSF